MQLDKYASRKRGVNTEGTINIKLCVLGNIEDFIGGGEPTTEDVHDYLDSIQESHSAGTLQQYFYMLKDYCKVMGVDIDFDSIKRRIPVYTPKSPDIMTREQVQQVIQEHEYKERTRTLSMLLYTYARRLDEVRVIKKSAIDFDNNIITFPIEKRSDIDTKAYEMEPMVRSRLKKWAPSSGYVFPGNISDILGVTTVWLDLKYLCRFHDIEQIYSPHSLRHSRVSHLHDDGIDWLTIKDELTLHRSLSVLQNTYGHATEEAKKNIPSLSESL